MEVDPAPRPLGLVIVAVIAALLWSLAAPSLGAGNDDAGSGAPPGAASPP